MAPSPPPSSSPTDPSPDRGIEGTLPRSSDPKSVATPEDSKDSCFGFILDSGVAEHATGSVELLSETRAPEDGGASFRSCGRKDLPVVAVGSINTPRFDIPDVRLVPELGTGSTLIPSASSRGGASLSRSVAILVTSRSGAPEPSSGRAAYESKMGSTILTSSRSRKAEAFAPTSPLSPGNG